MSRARKPQEPEQRVLVTGGATGIGLGIAAALVGAGYKVVITGRRPDVLREAARRIGATAMPWDVTRDPETLLTIASPIHHLVNNAGHYEHAGVDEWTAEHFRAMYEVHVVAPAMLTRALAMEPTEGERCVVNIGSTLATRGIVGAAAYAAAKAAQVSLTQSLARELGPRGVRVNAVLPGVLPTDMTRAPRMGDDPDARLEALRGLHPLGRLGTPADVAEAVLWLMRSPWVTGSVLTVDGGLSVA